MNNYTITLQRTPINKTEITQHILKDLTEIMKLTCTPQTISKRQTSGNLDLPHLGGGCRQSSIRRQTSLLFYNGICVKVVEA